MNRPVLSLAAVACSVTLCLTAAGTTHAASSSEDNQPTPARQARQTFDDRCSTCHAEHGEGSEAGAALNVPDLRSATVQRNSDATLRRILREGKGNMPAFNRDFTEAEIDQLILLLRGFADSSRTQQKPPGSEK